MLKIGAKLFVNLRMVSHSYVWNLKKFLIYGQNLAKCVWTYLKENYVSFSVAYIQKCRQTNRLAVLFYKQI
jgi:hypothetical protein